MVLRQDLENTVYSELGGLRRAVGVPVRARSTTLYFLPVTGERRKLAISSSPVGRIDKRSHFLDRAEPMGSSAQR